MNPEHEILDDELLEESTEDASKGWDEDDFGIFSDDDPAPADRRRDPLRKHFTFERIDT